MPKITEMMESKFLRKEDVGRGLLVTVADVTQKNVSKEGAEEEKKWCLLFHESDKPLVLNSTNIQLCQRIFGSDDTDHWTNKRIVLYVDPNVSYAGKLIGGIRVRAPKPTAPPPVAVPVVATEEIYADDIPFSWLVPFIVPVLALWSFWA